MMYYYVLLFLIIMTLILRRFVSSPTGRVLQAIRDNEQRARFLGYDTKKYKLIALVVAGMASAAAGIMFALLTRFANTEILSVQTTLNALLYTIAGGTGTLYGSIIDYTNPRVRFMYNFGDGGAAALLQKGLDNKLILETDNITAGFFSKHVKVLDGGSVNPLSKLSCSSTSGMLDVIDPEEMKEHLDPITFDHFVGVIKNALEKSGKSLADLDFLAPIHFKRSLHLALLEALGLKDNQSFYLEDYGHVQAADQIIALKEAEKRGLLKKGATVALMAAGTGYTWGSTILQY